jgi:hypothetical protein
VKPGVIVGVVAASVLHGGFLAFGGLLLPEAQAGHASTHEVELLEEIDAKPEVEEPPPDEPLVEPEDAPPEAPALDEPEPAPTGPPALDAASL